MKKLILLVVCSIFLAGCAESTETANSDGGVSQEEYDKVVAERDAYKKELDALKEVQAETEEKQTEKEDTEKIQDDEVQTDDGNNSVLQLSGSDLNNQIGINEYSYVNSLGTAWYILEVTNNSSETVEVETNVIAKDAEGNIVGAGSGSENAIESGYAVCIPHMFSDVEPETYEYTFSVKQEERMEPVLSDLSYESSDTGEKVIVTCTNNGEEAARFVEGTVLFLLGNELIYCDTSYFTDNDNEIKPGNTIAKEFGCYTDKKYDNFKVYFTGRR